MYDLEIGEKEITRGYTLFWKRNEAGGRTYYSDEIGGGVFVWDSCLVAPSTLLAAIELEREMMEQEKQDENRSS